MGNKTENLTLTKQAAIEMYRSMDATGKSLLEKQFGKETFIEKDITSKLKSFKDACKIKGVSEEEILPWKKPKNNRQRAGNLMAMLDLISEVLQEGWQADYDDPNQEKWYGVFEKRASSFVFSYSFYDYSDANTLVGSRLCQETQKKSDYFCKQFLPLHNELLTLKKDK